MNIFSAFTGEDCHGNECTRAVNYFIESDESRYSDEIKSAGQAFYKVYYKLDKKYKNFISELTSGTNGITVNIRIYADDTVIYGMGITSNTAPIPLNIDVSETDMLVIEISTTLRGSGFSVGNIILNNAYFE